MCPDTLHGAGPAAPDVALRVFQLADAEGITPAVAADRLAEQRMRDVGRLATIRLPR